jgi:hypothetical protein
MSNHEDKDASFFVNAKHGETAPKTHPQQKLNSDVERRGQVEH